MHAWLSVYKFLLVCGRICVVKPMYCTLCRGLEPLVASASESIKSDRWATYIAVSGENRKTESSGNDCHNFSNGLKHKERQISQGCQSRWKNILLYPCPCTRQRMSHWGCPLERHREVRSWGQDKKEVWRWNCWTVEGFESLDKQRWIRNGSRAIKCWSYKNIDNGRKREEIERDRNNTNKRLCVELSV